MSLPIDPEQVQSDVDAICLMVADGKTLRQVSTETGLSLGTILNRVSRETKHVEQYARARETASDLFETDIIEAALASSPETASADRVKIDALKWVAARRSPKKYGDKVQQEHSGSVNLNGLTDDDLDRKIAAALAASEG